MNDADVPAVAEVSAAAFGIDIAGERGRRLWYERVSHLLTTDPDGAFVGERGGRIAGVAQAMQRERLWCLSLMTVDPRVQSDGIGQALFRRALGYGDGRGNGLIVSSNDPRALRMYAAGGFSLRPALQAEGTVKRQVLPAGSAVRVADPDEIESLEPISRAIRGASHTLEIAFALDRGAQVLRLGDRGFAVAQEGRGVWLLAARDDDAARELLWAALEIGGDTETPIRWITAGQDWAVEVAVRAGLRLSAYGALCVRGRPGPLRPFLPSPPFA